MAQKRNTARGQVATAPAPSGVPKATYSALLVSGQTYTFKMLPDEFDRGLQEGLWRPEPGKILVMSGCSMISKIS